jgi:hypothetical protein
MKRLTTARALCITLSLALSPITTYAGQRRARKIGSRVKYSGSNHTRNHSGHYAGGRGSSHKGGRYRNARTGNRYGRHK